MGATGYTIFEDDSCADWIAGFLKKPSIKAVQIIFDQAKSSKYLDVPAT